MSFRTRHHRMSLILGLLLIATLLSTLPATAAPTTASFAAAGMQPGFRADVSDYVLHDCATRKVQITFAGVGAADRVNGRKLSVDRRKRAVWTKALQADELVEIRLASRKRTYFLRCLPDDFPRLQLDVNEPALASQGYYMLPYYSRTLQGQNFASRYYIITDSRGTPVWYRRTSGGSTVLAPDGRGRLITQGVLDGISPGAARPENSVKIVTLDGRTVSDVKPADALVRPAQRTESGGLLLLSAPRREHVDFRTLSTKFKDNSNGVCSVDRSDVTVTGLRITELAQDGTVLWDADLTEQIGFEEPSQASITNVALPGQTPDCVLDLFHQNHVSAAEDGSGFVVSLRWSGVYFVDRASAKITWKIGGSTTPLSLKVQSDPLGTAGPVAQHGGHLTADGRLLVFDNQLQKHILARAVEYYIDTAVRSASYLRAYALDASFCVTADGTLTCQATSQGDAEYLSDGSVLVSWGNTDGRSHLASVFTADGRVIATLHDRSPKGNAFAVHLAPANTFKLGDLRRYASSKPSDEIRNGTYD